MLFALHFMRNMMTTRRAMTMPTCRAFSMSQRCYAVHALCAADDDVRDDEAPRRVRRRVTMMMLWAMSR